MATTRAESLGPMSSPVPVQVVAVRRPESDVTGIEQPELGRGNQRNVFSCAQTTVCSSALLIDNPFSKHLIKNCASKITSFSESLILTRLGEDVQFNTRSEAQV